MKKYKFYNKDGISYTTNDRIMAEFMNKRLSLWQRLLLWFRS